jgi:hypothetical protein
MKARIISASLSPARLMNSWKGSTTASRKVFGALPATSGSRAKSASSMPGSMNSAVMTKTCSQGRRSARISESEPGTSPAMR